MPPHFEKSTPYVLARATNSLRNFAVDNNPRHRFPGTPPYIYGEAAAVESAANVKISDGDHQLRKEYYTWHTTLPTLPLNQFLSQAAREADRLDRQLFLGHGRQWTLPWNKSQDVICNAENNIRVQWINQGIWGEEWGPAWAENISPWTLHGQIRPPDGDADWGCPFKQLRHEHDVFQPFPNSWGHEKKPVDDEHVPLMALQSAQMPPYDLGEPEKLIPTVPSPANSRPAAQFRHQVARERDWIRNEHDYNNPGLLLDNLDTLAQESVRRNWIEDGIWRPEWDERGQGQPFGRWFHEIPAEDEETEPPIGFVELGRISTAYRATGVIHRKMDMANAKAVARFLAEDVGVILAAIRDTGVDGQADRETGGDERQDGQAEGEQVGQDEIEHGQGEPAAEAQDGQAHAEMDQSGEAPTDQGGHAPNEPAEGDPTGQDDSPTPATPTLAAAASPASPPRRRRLDKSGRHSPRQPPSRRGRRSRKARAASVAEGSPRPRRRSAREAARLAAGGAQRNYGF